MNLQLQILLFIDCFMFLSRLLRAPKLRHCCACSSCPVPQAQYHILTMGTFVFLTCLQAPSFLFFSSPQDPRSIATILSFCFPVYITKSHQSIITTIPHFSHSLPISIDNSQDTALPSLLTPVNSHPISHFSLSHSQSQSIKALPIVSLSTVPFACTPTFAWPLPLGVLVTHGRNPRGFRKLWRDMTPKMSKWGTMEMGMTILISKC